MVMLLKILTRTRKRVMRRAILPGIMSGGTTKLIHETTTNNPEILRTDGEELNIKKVYISSISTLTAKQLTKQQIMFLK